MASQRRYLTQEQLIQFADIDVIHPDEADDQISQAEELIDSYVGFQQKAVAQTLEGKVSAATNSTVTLESHHQNTLHKDYLKYCAIEVIGGTGAGQRRIITGSTWEGVVTVDAVWTTTPDTTSFYHIFQLGKFPRIEDVFFNSRETPSSYYKKIPEAVTRAVAAQVQFVIEMGEKYFSTDKSHKTSESIGDYAYSKDKATGNPLIAPKAKLLLKGIINRTGQLYA